LLLMVSILIVWFEWMLIAKGTNIGIASGLEITDIDDCNDNDRVKIHGIIHADTRVVISGEYNKFDWHGDIRDFSIIDITESIEVIPRKVLFDDTAFEVFSAPHKNNGNDEFWDKDEVWAVGTIITENHGKILVLESISGEKNGFSYPYLEVIFSTMMLAINGMLVGFILLAPMESKAKKKEIGYNFWSNTTAKSSLFNGTLGAGFVIGTLPAIWALLYWDGWFISCLFWWIIGALVVIKARVDKTNAQTKANYAMSRSIKEKYKFKHIIDSLEKELKNENIKFKSKVEKNFQNDPIKARYYLPDYEVYLNAEFSSYKSKKSVNFQTEPINFYNKDKVLSLSQRIIENTLDKFAKYDET